MQKLLQGRQPAQGGRCRHDRRLLEGALQARPHRGLSGRHAHAASRGLLPGHRAAKKGAKTHKVARKTSPTCSRPWSRPTRRARDRRGSRGHAGCEAEHVDGSMNASEKEAKLDWLKAETPENTCRILSNVRCLSEGVDVPALDAVLFLTPRNSQVDVVQSVGRVMRNAPGKKRGYVVLPVVIPAGIEPHEALNDNKTYEVVWQVLQALRSHDDRFDAMINKLDLIGKDTSKMEVIAITDKIQRSAPKRAARRRRTGAAGKRSASAIGRALADPARPEQTRAAIRDRRDREAPSTPRWCRRSATATTGRTGPTTSRKIASTHIDRITASSRIRRTRKNARRSTLSPTELRDDLNDSITRRRDHRDAGPAPHHQAGIRCALRDYSFASHNPMSQAMQGVLDVLARARLDKEADTLERFYESVKLRAEGIDSAEGKQKIIVELYDKFFRNAFPENDRAARASSTRRSRSWISSSRASTHVLQTEFGQTLGSKGVHILDPFTGTGTFITRLLQSGLITAEGAAAQVPARNPRQRDRAAGLLHRRNQHRGGLLTASSAASIPAVRRHLSH